MSLDQRGGRSAPQPSDSWRIQAACLGADTDLFFIEHGGSYQQAVKICADCPVRVDCLEWALATRTEYGVFGGVTPDERWRIRRRRRRLAG
jgi:WhiB family redox-sensing transcriptional regulator